ncbi:MAG: helix-turn-helix domain-containing protein, partial [Runella zeae]
LYVLNTNLLLKKHRKRILHQFSNQDKINLHWLHFLFYAMGLIWALIIGNQDDQLIFSSASIFAIGVGYFGIKQVGIFTNQYPAAIASNTPLVVPLSHEEINLEKKKYAKSGLNEESAQELHKRLSALMEQQKTFKEPELTLVDLASQLDIHPNYLSQIINDIEGVHFYDYINNLRIAEFKKMAILPENQRFTILALAYECGFNSKSSFNRCFKKTTQLSPSEYMKQALEML